MKRVLIVGCAGAGKSTFAKKLSIHTDLPVAHLDKLYWKPGWKKSDKQNFTLKVQELVEEESWIIDGNYKSSLPLRLTRADTVIFLDPSNFTCLWYVFLRTLRSYGKVREDMPQGCPERFDWEFIKYIWRFPHDYRPVLTSILRSFEGDVVHLRRFSEYHEYLESQFS